ncbi:MAG: glycosyltransferase family 39 protein [Candidatus Eremiobacteraeota bacterium]|nr:glycosyltransferase family 39 protein [Candidatus Eremiobacteraeota bacterium]
MSNTRNSDNTGIFHSDRILDYIILFILCCFVFIVQCKILWIYPDYFPLENQETELDLIRGKQIFDAIFAKHDITGLLLLIRYDHPPVGIIFNRLLGQFSKELYRSVIWGKALLTFPLALVMYFFGSRLWGRTGGLCAGVICISSTLWLRSGTHFGTDNLLVLFVPLTLYFLFRSWDSLSGKHVWLFGIFFILGLFTKVTYFLFIIFPLLYFHIRILIRDKKTFWLNFYLGFLLVLFAILIICKLESGEFKDPYLDGIFWISCFGGFLGTVRLYRQKRFFYANLLLIYLIAASFYWPWLANSTIFARFGAGFGTMTPYKILSFLSDLFFPGCLVLIVISTICGLFSRVRKEFSVVALSFYPFIFSFIGFFFYSHYHFTRHYIGALPLAVLLSLGFLGLLDRELYKKIVFFICLVLSTWLIQGELSSIPPYVKSEPVREVVRAINEDADKTEVYLYVYPYVMKYINREYFKYFVGIEEKKSIWLVLPGRYPEAYEQYIDYFLVGHIPTSGKKDEYFGEYQVLKKFPHGELVFHLYKNPGVKPMPESLKERFHINNLPLVLPGEKRPSS